eukprot:TRINITY_DN557_c0_g2_i1.p5 TRINITY_DN557_c0_g2~~TRINITY_DN557_c0_g2_i1.p5  ORF type:complete len:151 (+),score=15.19 TRINITY_DN557_c0_g2_i1:153-605(+)
MVIVDQKCMYIRTIIGCWCVSNCQSQFECTYSCAQIIDCWLTSNWQLQFKYICNVMYVDYVRISQRLLVESTKQERKIMKLKIKEKKRKKYQKKKNKIKKKKKKINFLFEFFFFFFVFFFFFFFQIYQKPMYAFTICEQYNDNILAQQLI